MLITFGSQRVNLQRVLLVGYYWSNEYNKKMCYKCAYIVSLIVIFFPSTQISTLFLELERITGILLVNAFLKMMGYDLFMPSRRYCTHVYSR